MKRQRQPQTGALLFVTAGNHFTYYSASEKRWRYGARSIPLVDICGLNSDERDKVLAAYQAQRRAKLRKKKRSLDKRKKTA